MTLTVGERLGPYVVVDKIGEGATGEVYRARDERLGREVALKVLSNCVNGDRAHLGRFAREARAAGALNHPNLLAVYDFSDGEPPYLVAELLDGKTLRQALADGPLPTRKALDYAVQIARGLAAAHAKDIVHRDLKPENLFITRDGRVKILDFGLAKGPEPPPEGTLDDARTGSGVILGTLGYMAPEQVQGRPVDARADLFALGAIVYEMLAGKRAFSGPTSFETAWAIARAEPEPLAPVVSPAVERVVMRCLEKDPADRFQTARDLVFALEALSAPSGEAPIGRARPRAKFGRVQWIGLAMLLAGVGYAVGFGEARRLDPERPPTPKYQRLTFRSGSVFNARFAPDGRTILYSGIAGDELMTRVFSITPGNPEALPITRPGTGLASVSPSGELALLLNPRHESMKGSVLARGPIGGGAPREMVDGTYWADWAPDGNELAVVRREGYGQRLEFPVGNVAARTDGYFSWPRVSPQGDAVAFISNPIINDNRGTVEMIGRDGRRRTLTPLWAAIEGLAWSPDGSEVWFTAATAGNLRWLHAVGRDGRVRDLAAAPGTMNITDVAKDGRALVIRHDQRWRVRAIVDGEAKERELSWFDTTLPVDITPDGKRLLFIEGGDTVKQELEVWFRDLDGSPAVHLGEGNGFAISPDGKWVLMSPKGPYERLLLVPTGPGQSRQLPAGRIASYLGASFFPDGKRIGIRGAEAGHRPRAWVQDLDGGDPRPVTDEGVVAQRHVSPDGKRGLVRANERIAVMSLDGGTPRPLDLPDEDVLVNWTPDGHTVIMVHADPEDASLELYRFDVDSGRRTPLRTITSHDQGKLWPVLGTPDGRVLVYGLKQTPSDLFLVDGLR